MCKQIMFKNKNFVMVALIFILGIVVTAFLTFTITRHLLLKPINTYAGIHRSWVARTNLQQLNFLHQKKYDELKASLEEQILVEVNSLKPPFKIAHEISGDIQQLVVELVRHQKKYPEDLKKIFADEDIRNFIETQYAYARKE